MRLIPLIGCLVIGACATVQAQPERLVFIGVRARWSGTGSLPILAMPGRQRVSTYKANSYSGGLILQALGLLHTAGHELGKQRTQFREAP